MGLALLGASLPMLLGTSLGILARVPWSADRPSWSNESSDVEPVWPRQKTDERLGIDSGWIQMVIFPQEFVLLVSCPRLFGQDFHRHTNRDMLVSLKKDGSNESWATGRERFSPSCGFFSPVKQRTKPHPFLPPGHHRVHREVFDWEVRVEGVLVATLAALLSAFTRKRCNQARLFVRRT